MPGTQSRVAQLLGKGHLEFQLGSRRILDFRLRKAEEPGFRGEGRDHQRRVTLRGKKQVLSEAARKRGGGPDAMNHAASIHTLAGVIHRGQTRLHGVD